jgi:hypothetical protein
LPIDCLHSWLYEPYLVVRYCREMPPFQEAFTGYGRNKVSWMTHSRRLGHKYQQPGGAFVIHFPHAYSKARLHFDGPSTKALSEKKVQVDKLYSDFAQWLNETVRTDATMPFCEGVVDTQLIVT